MREPRALPLIGQPLNLTDGILLPMLVQAFATPCLKVILDLMKKVTSAMGQSMASLYAPR